MKLNSRNLFDSYCRGWLIHEGSKPAKNDLAGVRRTRTALKGLLSSQFEDVLQPEHVLALRAAASVLDELDGTIASIIKPLEAEQQRRLKASASSALAAVDEYIVARPGDPWFQSEAAAEAELALLGEFFDGQDGKEWLKTARGADYVMLERADRGELHRPDPKLVKVTAVHELAIRLSGISKTGRVEKSRGFRGQETWARAGLDDFQTWKNLRAHAAGAIEKAKASV